MSAASRRPEISMFLFALVAAGLWSASARGTAAAEQPTMEESVDLAFERARQGDCEASLTILTGLLDEAGSADLPEARQADIYTLASWCAVERKDRAAGYRFAVAGTRSKGATTELWHKRLGFEFEDKEYAQVVETIETMATGSTAALEAVQVRWLHMLNGSLRDRPDRTLQRRLLAVLTAPGLQPQQGPTVHDPFRLQYAALKVADGDRPAAAALIARIVEPTILMDASVDPRLRDLLPAGFDGRDAAEQRLVLARRFAADRPDSLFAAIDVARYLRLLGRPGDALEALDRAHPDRKPGTAYTDIDEQRNWFWDELARAYQGLGRVDDAVAAFRTGVAAKESGNLNVSQTINLGGTQLRFGRPADALTTLAAFDRGGHDVSPFGTMQLALMRGCARLAAGQQSAARADVDYATAHEQDAPLALLGLLLCAGDMDGAAALIVRRLDDPEGRSSALLHLSDYDPPPATYPVALSEARLPELKARPDVRAAVLRAGGTRRFRVQFDDL